MNLQPGNTTVDALPTPAGPRTSRRWLLIGGLSALLAAGGTTAWIKAQARATAAAPTVTAATVLELLPQDLARVGFAELQRTISLTGTLQPLNRSDVKSPLPGQLVSVTVREGERVRKGQVLATLDSSDLQARLRDRQAALEGGQAQLALAAKMRQNNLVLLDKNFISQAAFDNAQGSYQAAAAAVKSLQAQVEQSRKALADAVVRSPIDGIVAERFAEPGLSVPANAALLSVHDLSQMELEVLVPTGQIPAVRIGQKTSFGIEGFAGQRFDGRVERISPSAAAGARSIAVYVRIANPQQTLRGGMFAQGTIAVAEGSRGLVVPAAAVREAAGMAHVLRIDGNTLAEVPVKLGQRDEAKGQVEVVQGLADGDRVLVSDAANLKAGQQVRVVSPPAQASTAATAHKG